MKTVWIVKDATWAGSMVVAIAETEAKAWELRKKHIKAVNYFVPIDQDLVYVEEQNLNEFVVF